MENMLLKGMKEATNFAFTENGAITHKSTNNNLLDMFALGGAYRSRSDEDCILLFKNAFEESPLYALKCLFYLRDIIKGQGERRFFRVCMRWFADKYPDTAKKNFAIIPEIGRWDDLYIFDDTKVESEMYEFLKAQLAKDLVSLQAGEKNSVSLLGKWLKSCNASSKETKRLGNKTREYFGMTQRQYRKTLAQLRERIKIVEKLMSENRWEEIEFDKVPSRAGLIYRNAFARRDITKEKYEKFIKDDTTKVNAKTLYPYEVVQKARLHPYILNYNVNNDIERQVINKYWDNLTDYFNNATFNALAVVDTSGSMTWSNNSIQPIDVAISLGMYCAERAAGPFAGHYISFASRPQLIAIKGIDFVDKVKRIEATNLCDNTNIEATFDMILDTIISNNLSQEDLPENIIIISDMEFDNARSYRYGDTISADTLMESIEKKWNNAGFKMPNLIYWNVDARNNNIPMTVKNGISFVSGFSPSIFEQIMSGKTAFDLMYEVLNNERYSNIIL